MKLIEIPYRETAQTLRAMVTDDTELIALEFDGEVFIISNRSAISTMIPTEVQRASFHHGLTREFDCSSFEGRSATVSLYCECSERKNWTIWDLRVHTPQQSR